MSKHASTEDKAQVSRYHPRKHGIHVVGSQQLYETFVHLIPKGVWLRAPIIIAFEKSWRTRNPTHDNQNG